jgi:hypothetical protein
MTAVRDNAAMEAELPNADPPKPGVATRKRRWFQFRLRYIQPLNTSC